MSENTTMIRDTEGRYWMQTTDDDGRRRSSYVGNIGQASIVEAWCLGKGIEFRQVQSSPGPGRQRARFAARSGGQVFSQREFAAIGT